MRNIVSIPQQLATLRRDYPQFKSKITRNKLVVTGKLQPTARSPLYSFLLQYSLSKKPSIRIVSPRLVRNEQNEIIPHMYSQKYLCLYQPKYREFQQFDSLSKTVIPWTSLWLYYYELWHLTGKWLGGGEHPKPRKK